MVQDRIALVCFKATGGHEWRLCSPLEVGHPIFFGQAATARKSLQLMISGLRLFSKQNSAESRCWLRLSTGCIPSGQKMWVAPSRQGARFMFFVESVPRSRPSFGLGVSRAAILPDQVS